MNNKLLKILLFSMILVKNSIQIYDPTDLPQQKPPSYTDGIKSWQKPIQYYHNYSKVNHQNFHQPKPIYKNIHEEIKLLEQINDNDNQTVILKKRRHSPKIEIYRKCPEGSTGQFVYELSCNQFLNCWKGRGYPQNCAPGTLFNPKSLECDFMDKVACLTGPRQQQRSAKLEVVEQVGCPAGFSGLIPNYFNCSKYILCDRGRQHQRDCATGTLFDVNRNLCDHPHRTECFNSETSLPAYIDTKLDFKSNQHNNAECHSKIEDNPCKHKTGLFRHPNRCDKFIQCANGQRFEQDCAPGTLFNPKLSVCDFPYNVNCEKSEASSSSVSTSWQQTKNCDNSDFEIGHETSTGNYYPNTGRLELTSSGGNWQDNTNSNQATNAHHYPNSNTHDSHRTEAQNNGRFDGIRTNSQQPTKPYQYGQNSNNCVGTSRCEFTGVYNTHYPHQPDTTKLRPLQPNNYNHQESQINHGLKTTQHGYVPENPQHNYQPSSGQHQSNYNHVININQHLSSFPTQLPHRNSYQPFYGSTSNRPPINDFNDFEHTNSHQQYQVTTPQNAAKHWPPPFPSTDTNADYFFEYDEHHEVTLEASGTPQKQQCKLDDHYCLPNECIPTNLVCNNIEDCLDGSDEKNCHEYGRRFSVKKGRRLAVLEKEKWYNMTIATCALMCIKSTRFECKSFNYRHDRTCYLLNGNIASTGALISHHPCDYYEKYSTQSNCTNLFKCPNEKCIKFSQKCDGHDDCGDRTDEKGCRPEDIGYSIKLVGSQHKHEGRIQIQAFGRSGYICDDLFGLRDAHVACKELGYSGGAIEVKSNSYFSTSEQHPFYMMDDLECFGNETSLMDCNFGGWGVHNCNSQEVVGVICKAQQRQEKCPKDYWQCNTGQECLPLAFVCDGLLDCSDESDESLEYCGVPTALRLVNGTTPKEGRLEIKHNGIWGSVCDDDFNEDAAKVVCKSLGFLGSATVKKEAYFGQASGPIWLDQVNCLGNESTLESCSHWEWSEHNCDHSEDVGIICSAIHLSERHSAAFRSPTRSYTPPARCGLRKDNIFSRNDDVHFRVVRGSKAQPGHYPWQAAIRVQVKPKLAHWCGAVVISEKFVLTAAHCLVGYSKGAYVIVAGDYNVDEDEGTEQTAYIEDYYIHQGFRKGHKMNNDIALVKLKGHGFRLNDDIQPICLPDDDTVYDTSLNCTISGFGTIKSGKSGYSHDLRAGWVPMQTRSVCMMDHVYGKEITDGMICAGSLDEGTDSCDGDSGGPLACLQNGLFTLYGITSWGQRCGYANKPGVYVKVAHYKKWIDSNLAKLARDN